MSRSDIQNPALISKARQAVVDVFEALSHWRDENFYANDRCLTKVLDKSDHVMAAVKEKTL